MISTPDQEWCSSKSLSPVTRDWQPWATAAAKTGSSSGSRNPAGLPAMSSRRSDREANILTSSSASSAVQRNLATSFSRTSAHRKGVVTYVQRGAAASTTRRQNPSWASAASQTLASSRTNTGQGKDFLFREARRVSQHRISPAPKIPQSVLLQPAINGFPLLARKGLQFGNDFTRTHWATISRLPAEQKQQSLRSAREVIMAFGAAAIRQPPHRSPSACGASA